MSAQVRFENDIGTSSKGRDSALLGEKYLVAGPETPKQIITMMNGG